MSDNHPKLNSHSNVGISGVISEGFRLFGKNYITLILPLGLLFIGSLIIKNILIVDLDWQVMTITPTIESILEKDPSDIAYYELELMLEYLILVLFSAIIDILITTIFNVVAMCLVSNYLYNKFIGNETKLIPELKNALKGRMLLVILLLGVGISAGSILLFIPAILIFVFYIFYIFTYHSDDSEHPIKEARDLARGAFWKIIVIFLVNYFLISACGIVYHLIIDNFLVPINNPSWYNPSTRDYGSIILYNVIYYIVPLLFTPLFICLLTSLFVFLKTRKEQNIQSQPFYQEIPQSDVTPKIENINGSGMYCPFCGKYLSKSTTQCPHCGEKLEFSL